MSSSPNEQLTQLGIITPPEAMQGLPSKDTFDASLQKLEIQEAISEHEFQRLLLDLDHFTEKLKKRNDEIERM